ncbi:DNA-binding GntR family transcriptional regulator [Natranaerovirga pectinivora]|uniref:DNA-binding GntR family transcriptional regulator n=1 Tax=Natranaerovirga pectinivora TaxID=682400 RepID=A0A4R3MLZ7_9FIRM|nr:GntR family transcriptional regulator [Natranaerovirga pectinivora]TCT15708.1 DNA-binding GntR family transcriptional regulator [Natranaerovirga pectinivora]
MGDIKTSITLVQEAYNILKNKITYLDLLPGQVISDHSLSKDLNMSRTPIKQALVELKRDGLLVDVVSGKGYQITKITKEEVIDLFDAREGIEVMALKIAMKNKIPIEDVKELIIFNEKILKSDSNDNLIDVFNNDQNFHIKLVSLSNNRRVIGYNENILLQLTRMRFLTYFQRQLPGQAVDEHTKLIRYIKDGNCDKAVEVLSEHIQKTKNVYLTILNTVISPDEFGVLKYLMNDKVN